MKGLDQTDEAGAYSARLVAFPDHAFPRGVILRQALEVFHQVVEVFV